MIYEFKNPVPAIVDEKGVRKDGYVWYVRDGGTWENDTFAIVLCDGGIVRFYRADQFTIHPNGTFDIKSKNNESKESQTAP